MPVIPDRFEVLRMSEVVAEGVAVIPDRFEVSVTVVGESIPVTFDATV